MSTEAKVPDTERLLREVSDERKAGIDAQQPQRIAGVFTDDALFRGLHPYSVGRQGVTGCYASQSPDMTVEYEVLQTHPLSADQVLGYVRTDFAFPDRPRSGYSSACGRTHPRRLEHRLLPNVPTR